MLMRNELDLERSTYPFIQSFFEPFVRLASQDLSCLPLSDAAGTSLSNPGSPATATTGGTGRTKTMSRPGGHQILLQPADGSP